MILIQNNNETIQDFIQRCLRASKTQTVEGYTKDGKYFKFATLEGNKPHLKNYVCIKNYLRFKKGDILRKYEGVWYNDTNSVISDEDIQSLPKHFTIQMTLA